MCNPRNVKIFICLFVLYSITGCAPKKYSFTIDAPPKYSSKHVFKKMQIKPFKSRHKEYGNTIVTLIKSGIVKEGYIRVVPKRADCLLTGTLNIGKMYKNYDSKSYDCTKYRNKKKYDTTCHSYEYTKKISIKVDYTLYNNRNREVVFGDSINEDFDQTWSSSESRSEATSNAMTDEQIINNVLHRISQKIVTAVTPHKETISRELQTGSDDNVELGITYLENGRVDQAVSIWNQCIFKAKSPESKAAAYYNLGVVKESKGLYREAFELYSEANALLPAEKLYIQSMTRSEGLKAKTTTLRHWKK